MRHYTTNENHGEDILKAIAKIEALENNFKYSQKEADDFAIGFALFLSKNMYENIYKDIDEDGKTWVSYFQIGFDDLSTAKRFTIQELLEIYKKEKGL
jgi:hypothetical protein